MPDQPYPLDFNAPRKPSPRPPPTACLLRIADSYCLRSIPIDEFVFRDAEYAMSLYADGKGPLRICSACKLVFLKRAADAASGNTR